MDLTEVVVAVSGGVIIVVAIGIYRAWKKARAAALAAPCALFAPSGIIGMFPDECLGACGGRARCTAAGTRPYFIFWTQDIGPCTCPPLPPLAPLGPKTAGGSGSK
jgi:hypothetical protein